MTDHTQIPFSDAAFAENAEPRCPCVLVLDTSGSMQGRAIAELNAGLLQFHDELASDPQALKRVEVAIVTFGPVQTVIDFTVADQFNPPSLHASGQTPMGEAIQRAIGLVEDRKATYRRNGIDYFRPWIFLVTDGAPTDSWSQAAEAVRAGEAANKFMFFAVAVEDGDLTVLQQIATRPPLKLSGLRFRDLFSWLSKSLKSVAHSQLGEKVPLSPPGWAEIG